MYIALLALSFILFVLSMFRIGHAKCDLGQAAGAILVGATVLMIV